MIDLFTAGFAALFTPTNLLLMLGGVVLGIIFGSLPGLSTTMAVALCLPLTYGLSAIPGMALLIGLYIGGISGGLVSAILLHIPGTPSSVATCFDGAPMAARGEAGKALGVGVVFSFIGTLLGVAVLVLLAPEIARAALKFSFYEYFAVGVFSMTMISGLIGKNVEKGLVSGCIGMFIGCVGSAPIDGLPRLTFGIHALDGGFTTVPVLIGMFAISEILRTVTEKNNTGMTINQNFKVKGFGFTWAEFKSQFVNTIRSAAIGIGIGILPGIGGGTSNILAYTAAKKQSKHPEKFGTGIIDGIVASETANNATIGGALVPLLTLGIPGDAVTAMLLGGLTIQGLAPGPMLFTTNADLVYAIFAACIICNFMMLAVEWGGLRAFVRILSVPKYILMPIVMVLCVIGGFGVNNRIFDVWALLGFGLLAMGMSKFDIPQTPAILGFILGPTIEKNLRRGLISSQGSWAPFFTRPISLIFLIAAVAVIIFTVIKEIKARKNETDKTRTEGNA